MGIIWSPQALEDIESIADFIALDNSNRAQSFIDELIRKIERLIDFPESGPIVEDNPVFRQLMHQTYRIIYQFRQKKILIIAVLGPGRSVQF